MEIGNMSAHKKFQLKAQNWELAVDRYKPPGGRGCIMTQCTQPCDYIEATNSVYEISHLFIS